MEIHLESFFDANDTQVPPNLERKTGNSDFIHERGDKISFEKPFLDKESIIDFPKRSSREN
jgi:hypothetical protein